MAMTDSGDDLVVEILRWKTKRRAMILAHNYQAPEVQDIADIVGDSLALARAAADTDAEVLVFCGVYFMAETAAILSPDKTVLLPDPQAGCSLADAITAQQLHDWKAQHPHAVVVSYVNTTAEVKALSDYCCTSANAVQIVQSIPEDQEILFLPDLFLGSYVKRVTGRDNMRIWMGECHVHAGIEAHQVETVAKEFPSAEVLVHPECGCSTSSLHLLAEGLLPNDRTHVLSTGGMLTRARDSKAQAFIVATETGILHQMQKANPTKRFIAANPDAVCPYMKMITLEKILHALREMDGIVTVPEHIRGQARLAIDRMVATV